MKKKMINTKTILLLMGAIIGLAGVAVTVRLQKKQEIPMKDISPANEVGPSKDVDTESMPVKVAPVVAAADKEIQRKGVAPTGKELKKEVEGISWTKKIIIGVVIVLVIAIGLLWWYANVIRALYKVYGVGKSKEALLYENVAKGDVQCLKGLVWLSVDINAKDDDGSTALICSAYWGNLEMVQCLCEQGANIKTKDKNGRTALHCSAQMGRLGVVKYLVKKGNYVNDDNGLKTKYTQEVQGAMEQAKSNCHQETAGYLQGLLEGNKEQHHNTARTRSPL